MGLLSGLFPSGFPIKILYTPLFSPIRATCPAHPILLDFITRTKLGEEYRSLSSSLCSFLLLVVAILIKYAAFFCFRTASQFKICIVPHPCHIERHSTLPSLLRATDITEQPDNVVQNCTLGCNQENPITYVHINHNYIWKETTNKSSKFTDKTRNRAPRAITMRSDSRPLRLTWRVSIVSTYTTSWVHRK